MTDTNTEFNAAKLKTDLDGIRKKLDECNNILLGHAATVAIDALGSKDKKKAMLLDMMARTGTEIVKCAKLTEIMGIGVNVMFGGSGATAQTRIDLTSILSGGGNSPFRL